MSQPKPFKIDLAGKRFGKLTAVRFITREVRNNPNPGWLCVCDCGSQPIVNSYQLRARLVRSCGCLRIKTVTKHGMHGSLEYKTWQSMKQRCHNPKDASFADYGGRGITVCKRWHRFENFFADMGRKPPGHSLERVDNSKGYSRENCRWATWLDQQNNRRSSRFLTFRGETKTVSQWSRVVGINYVSLLSRLMRHGWSVEKALTTPARYKQA